MSEERFDGKTHVPDEASNSTGSGMVCRHCGEAISRCQLAHELANDCNGFVHWDGCHLCQDDTTTVAEPAPAEQPRKLADMEDYCDDCPDNGKCLELGICRATISAPVAASPAEGPRQPKGDEFYLARLIHEGIDALVQYVGIVRAQHELAARDSAAQPVPGAKPQQNALSVGNPEENLYVFGDDKAIKICQDKLFEYEKMKGRAGAKVEEIARELVKRLNLEDEEESAIVAILRPYFPEQK